jgi:hypothetical protein
MGLGKRITIKRKCAIDEYRAIWEWSYPDSTEAIRLSDGDEIVDILDSPLRFIRAVI